MIRVHHSTRSRTATERLGLQPIQHQSRRLQARDQPDRHPPRAIVLHQLVRRLEPVGVRWENQADDFSSETRSSLRLQISRAIRNCSSTSCGQALADCAGLNQAEAVIGAPLLHSSATARTGRPSRTAHGIAALTSSLHCLTPIAGGPPALTECRTLVDNKQNTHNLKPRR